MNHPQVCKAERKSLLAKGVFVVFTPTSVWDQQQWLLARWGRCWKASSSCFHLQWPPRWSCFRNLSSRYSYGPSQWPVLQESSAGCLLESPARPCHSLCLCRHCKDRAHCGAGTRHRGLCTWAQGWTSGSWMPGNTTATPWKGNAHVVAWLTQKPLQLQPSAFLFPWIWVLSVSTMWNCHLFFYLDPATTAQFSKTFYFPTC